MVVVSTSLSLDFRPHGDFVGQTREFVHDLYRRLLVDHDEADRIALTTHELLENLVKYADDGPSSVEIRLQRQEGQDYVGIETRNSTTPERISELRDLLDRIVDSEDPIALYDDLIASSIERPGSGLGLARIRAEADMKLAYSIEGNEVTIRAEAPVSTRE